MDSNATIVAPVMRFIAVADLARTAAFYRDVLGFEVREEKNMAEAVCGPARLQFSVDSSAPDTRGESRPRGSAALFFQTDDIAAMQAAIRARGGNPSEVEKVNWIKMRMFEVRDPDGHTLWFGQSYHMPDSPAPPSMLLRIMPALPLDNVGAGIAHYRDVLGFHINHQQHDLGVMDRDDVTVLLIARTPQHKGIGSAYVYVENADTLYAELKAKGANLQGEPISHPWGLRDFLVLDPEGNEIRFGQPFE